jgi:hypothetical protein
MGLPVEVRNLVYHHLWLETPRIGPIIVPGLPPTEFRTRPRTLEATYGGDLYVLDTDGSTKKKLSGLPRWLLTSPQILVEGLNQMRFMTVWSLGDHIEEVQRADKEAAELEAFATPQASVTWWRGKDKVKSVGPRASIMELLSPVQHMTTLNTIEVGSLRARTHQDPGPLLHSIKLDFTLPDAPKNILQHCKQLKALRIRIHNAQVSRRPLKAMGMGVPIGLDLSNLLVDNLQLDKLEVVISEGIEWWLSENELEGDAAKLEADRISARLCPTHAQLLEAFKNEVVRVGEQVVSGRGEGRLVFHEDHPPASDNLGHDKLRFLAGSRTRSERPEMSEWKGTTLGWHFEYTKAKDCGKEEATTAPPQPLLENDGGSKTTMSKGDRGALLRAALSGDD